MHGNMKNSLSVIILMVITSFPASAQTMHGNGNQSSQPNNIAATNAIDDPGFVVIDIAIIRPASLLVTVAGAALFVGLSPLTALASIPEPHDAFAKTYEVLIGIPARYTFVRPVGDKSIAPYGASYRGKPTPHQ